jgi:predicted nucleotidyltransferase
MFMVNKPATQLGITELLSDKREAILKLAEQYGATNVRVFGSVARGEAQPDSDIDFLMQFSEQTNIFDMVGLWQDLTVLLQREVDLIADHPSGGRVTQMARKEAIPL